MDNPKCIAPFLPVGFFQYGFRAVLRQCAGRAVRGSDIDGDGAAGAIVVLSKLIEEIPVLTKQPIAKKLNASADVVWEAIRNIGRLDVWFPIIETCRVEGKGAGALRYMTVAGGGEIEDTIEEVDEISMRLTYLRPLSPFPVTYYKGTVEVFTSYDGLAVVVWTIDFESEPEDTASVAELVRSAISDGIDGMEKDLRSA
ncbi:MAG: SRPBCC family protein [Methylococcus sp.]|nr:SRPBCC family protein [Methylococcus sp.]